MLDIPISKCKAVCREDRTVAVNQNSLDSKQTRDLACMLATCTAKAC